MNLINHVIIIANYYISQVKQNQKPLYFIELLYQIKNKIELMIYSNRINDRENKDWQELLYNIF